MSNYPLRLKRRRSKGWRKPINAVIVDRTSRWGNPFETAEEFHDALYGVDSDDGEIICQMTPEQYKRMKHIVDTGHELSGKDLVCWCDPEHYCHADVLIEWANG